MTVYRKTRHNAACVNIEKTSIDFLKMYCFKPTEGNGLVYYSGNDLSYDNKTWRAQYLDADNSVSAKKKFSKGAAFSCMTVTYSQVCYVIIYTFVNFFLEIW